MSNSIIIEDRLLEPYYIVINKNSFNLCKNERFVKKEFSKLNKKDLKDDMYSHKKSSLGSFPNLELTIKEIVKDKIFDDKRKKLNQERKITLMNFLSLYKEIKEETEQLIKNLTKEI